MIEVLKQVQRPDGPSTDKCEAYAPRHSVLVKDNNPRLNTTHYLHTSVSLEAKKARQMDRVNAGVARYNKLDSNPSNPVTGARLASQPQSCPSCHATVRPRDRLVSRVVRVWLRKSTTQRPPDALYLGNNRGLGDQRRCRSLEWEAGAQGSGRGTVSRFCRTDEMSVVFLTG